MKNIPRLLPFLFLLATFVACKTVPLENQIYATDQAVTMVISDTDLALNQGVISKAQAESVSQIAHQINPLLDSARVALAAGDTSGADKTLKLINALMAGLQAYVPPPSKP